MKLMNIIQIINNILLKYKIISCLIAGGLLKFSFGDYKYYGLLCFILSFNILITLLNKCLENKHIKLSFIIGVSFGFTYFLFTLNWITNSFKYVGLSNCYAYLALLLLVTAFSVYPAIACIATVYFSTNKYNLCIYFAIFWTITEYLRSILFTGFPWNLIGYVAYKLTYPIQIADIFGIFGISFILLLIITLIRTKKQCIYGLILLLITLIYGFYKVELFNDYIIPSKKNNIIIVHPSIKQQEKMDNKLLWNNIDKHVYLSSFDCINNINNTLIIWPEAAINWTINDTLIKYLSSTVTNNSTLLLTGVDRINGNNFHNSAVIINNNYEIVKYYDKRHLVPFGEYIPNWISSIGLSKIASGESGFTAGTVSNTIKVNGYSQFDICICYEITFPGKVMDSPNTSEWILNITNDSWFVGSDEQYQHLVMVCFRAIEQGRSIARCNNNGISAIIDCHGKIIKSLNNDIMGNICEEMPKKYYNTIYSKYNNKLILILLGIVLIILIYKRYINKIYKLL